MTTDALMYLRQEVIAARLHLERSHRRVRGAQKAYDRAFRAYDDARLEAVGLKRDDRLLANGVICAILGIDILDGIVVNYPPSLSPIRVSIEDALRMKANYAAQEGEPS